MSAPDSILKLIENFDLHRRAYLSHDYNEAQVRREFIDPFFEVLGWDMFNKGNYASAYKDVIHEDAIQMGGATKAPDYAFLAESGRPISILPKNEVACVPEPA